MQKNYQIWHHRRCIFEMWTRQIAAACNTTTEKMNTIEECKQFFDNEYHFVEEIFSEDNKNYHAWSHIVLMVEMYQLQHDPRN